MKINFFLVLLILQFFFCIKTNNPNQSLLIYLSTRKTTNYIETFTTRSDWKGCLVGIGTSEKTEVLLCFEVLSSKCSIENFRDIINLADLNKRKDDLSLFSLIHTNCSIPSTFLQSIYNSSSTPTSFYLKYYGRDTGANNKVLSTAMRKSCNDFSFFPLSVKPKQRLLNYDELKLLQTWDSELALIPSITDSCLNDIGLSTTRKILIDKIRSKDYTVAYSCDSKNIHSDIEDCN